MIRKVSPAGIITTLAGSNYYQRGRSEVGLPTGVAVDAAGNLYIASGPILKLSSDGILSTVPGNVGGVAVALDAAGNLYISEGGLSGYEGGAGRVRKVTADGTVTTIAGNGASGYSGDGGPATSASLSPAAAGIAVDAGGVVYVADLYNSVIRVLRQ